MKKKVIISIIVFITIVVAAYLLMLINTNSVIREVRHAFMLELDVSDTIGRPIHKYNYMWVTDRGVDVGRVELSLCRLLTLHNFKNGYIWVLYTYKAYDVDGKILTGSANIFSKWKIEKKEGAWEIVEIVEAP